jgi:hypothetical protein
LSLSLAKCSCGHFKEKVGLVEQVLEHRQQACDHPVGVDLAVHRRSGMHAAPTLRRRHPHQPFLDLFACEQLFFWSRAASLII